MANEFQFFYNPKKKILTVYLITKRDTIRVLEFENVQNPDSLKEEINEYIHFSENIVVDPNEARFFKPYVLYKDLRHSLGVNLKITHKKLPTKQRDKLLEDHLETIRNTEINSLDELATCLQPIHTVYQQKYYEFFGKTPPLHLISLMFKQFVGTAGKPILEDPESFRLQLKATALPYIDHDKDFDEEFENLLNVSVIPEPKVIGGGKYGPIVHSILNDKIELTAKELVLAVLIGRDEYFFNQEKDAIIDLVKDFDFTDYEQRINVYTRTVVKYKQVISTIYEGSPELAEINEALNHMLTQFGLHQHLKESFGVYDFLQLNSLSLFMLLDVIQRNKIELSATEVLNVLKMAPKTFFPLFNNPLHQNIVLGKMIETVPALEIVKLLTVFQEESPCFTLTNWKTIIDNYSKYADYPVEWWFRLV